MRNTHLREAMEKADLLDLTLVAAPLQAQLSSCARGSRRDRFGK
jgi:hypothetical protein